MPATPSQAESSETAGVRLTNPDRVLYPSQGLTKRDLADYYAAIADWIMPHLADRPLTLVRCPEGHEKECFYQKHMRDSVPAGLRAIDLAEAAGSGRYAAVRTLAGLIGLVQIGVLEIHLWGCRIDRPEQPDRMIFDLDPDPEIGWPAVVEAARGLRDRLAEDGLASWVKTTGGKGLHVVVPLARRAGWDEMKEFSRRVVETVAGERPERYTSQMSKKKRQGKIFIDYLRNGRGATAVAAYSTRARPGAPVAAPVAWEELDRLESPAAFTVQNLRPRLESLAADPWADLAGTRQTLSRAARRRYGMD